MAATEGATATAQAAEAAEALGAASPDAPSDLGEPTVIADGLHVVYRVRGAAGRSGGGGPAALLRALTRRKGGGGAREVHAVKGVSFVARRGEAIGVIGSNGSGKSTLLRAVAGLIPPERGQVYTNGQPSLLGVNAALMNELPGERNVVLGCLAMGMTPAEVRERYDDIVDFSGINDKGDFISLPMRTYSSGMAARLRFAIAAARDHDVLLIDEALATGDRAFRKRSEKRIKELREKAGTVFLVSHSNKTIRDTCDRALWMERGELIMDGTAAEVVDAYEEANAD
ncbi:ABC transporter ATP-binding protein [Nocardiopsis sp. RSe5-2]|uniref:ABC transporter ATP-binding protein n=1 Tax=Nocardiopsis endophytica TaxID=3018445 RepID=A0ABT4U700_9ACTN|nr:ABC transporter ATP-binding protein [Nocardiopsis endophytica]MDA2812733.1 ABC transporter ATP-binding protein [Nocardiopsis endophytica]